MTKKKATPDEVAEPTRPTPAPRPHQGGSYTRDADGRLTRVAHSAEREA